MSSNELISVIVPIYGIDRYVGICIESILHQTYTNLEILLVDDGSPDRCPEICDLYARKDSRIKVIHKKNGGLVSARKAGLEASTGSFIGYVDGDDWIGLGFYETLHAAITTSNCDVVCAGQSRDLFQQSAHFTNPYPLGIYSGDRLKKLQENMLSFGEFYSPGITTYVWNKLFRRDVLYAHQMNVDERITIGEDAAVTYPVLMDAKSVYVFDCVAYHYRQREDSMLKQSTSFAAETQKLRFLYEYIAAFAQRYDANILKQVRDYVLGICIIRSGGRLPDNTYSTFSDCYFGKNVVICSAGTFGQQLIRRINERELCHVVCWIDDDYWEYRRCCLDVDPLSAISSAAYDYVLIASIDNHVAMQLRKRLLDYGVSDQKILLINCDKQDKAELLHRFLY